MAFRKVEYVKRERYGLYLLNLHALRAEIQQATSLLELALELSLFHLPFEQQPAFF